MTDLAILYEHPSWFVPLFDALDRRGVDYRRLATIDALDPLSAPPAQVVFNRFAMSAFLRDDEHPLFMAQTLFAHWQRRGAKVINGTAALALDMSKANQLSLLASLGLAVPRTLVVYRTRQIEAAADEIGFPLLLKANIGGAGAGIVRYDSREALRAAIADKTIPTSIDNILLVQEFLPARGGVITRVETLDRAYLYSIAVSGAGQFDLCPADACVAGSGISITAVALDEQMQRSVEAIAQAACLDVGGVEFMIDDRDGRSVFYDINALSNFVARPLEVLGWDPHERLVDRLVSWIREGR